MATHKPIVSIRFVQFYYKRHLRCFKTTLHCDNNHEISLAVSEWAADWPLPLPEWKNNRCTFNIYGTLFYKSTDE